MKTLTAFIVLISCTLGWTQEAEKGNESMRSCRIVFPERPTGAPKFAYLFDGKTSRRVNLPNTNFSEVITLPPGEFTIVMTPNEVAEPGNSPEGAPRVKITKGVRDFYIHVTSDSTNPVLPLQLNLVDLGNDRLKPGETLWINLTDHSIQAKLGESKMTAPPKSEVVTKDPLSESGYYRAEFTYQPHAQGDFKMVTEQSWWHDAKSRHLGFIVAGAGKLPKIYFYRDFR